MSWIDHALTLEGDPLVELFQRRVTDPERDGPTLDDRAGERPEAIFERLAVEHDTFRLRLESAFSRYIDKESEPLLEIKSRAVTRAMFESIQRLGLGACYSPIRAWLDKHQTELQSENNWGIAMSAVGALATSQPRGLIDTERYWMRLWRTMPITWAPKVFIGLRLTSPAKAVALLPDLIQRAKTHGSNPAPLIEGLWRQPEGKIELLTWIKKHPAASDEVESILADRLSAEERSLLEPAKFQRITRPMASLSPLFRSGPRRVASLPLVRLA